MLRSVLGPDPTLVCGTALLALHPTPLLTDVNPKTWAYSSAKAPHRWKLRLLLVMALLCPKCVTLYGVLCLPLCCMMYCAYHYAVWCIVLTIMLYDVLCLPLCCMVYCAYHYAVWCIVLTINIIMLYDVFCLPICCMVYCAYHYAVWCIVPTIMLYDVLCLPHWALRPV